MVVHVVGNVYAYGDGERCYVGLVLDGTDHGQGAIHSIGPFDMTAIDKAVRP